MVHQRRRAFDKRENSRPGSIMARKRGCGVLVYRDSKYRGNCFGKQMVCGSVTRRALERDLSEQ